MVKYEANWPERYGLNRVKYVYHRLANEAVISTISNGSASW